MRLGGRHLRLWEPRERKRKKGDASVAIRAVVGDCLEFDSEVTRQASS